MAWQSAIPHRREGTSRQTGRSRVSGACYTSYRASCPHHAQVPTLRQSIVIPNRPTSTESTHEAYNGQTRGFIPYIQRPKMELTDYGLTLDTSPFKISLDTRSPNLLPDPNINELALQYLIDKMHPDYFTSNEVQTVLHGTMTDYQSTGIRGHMYPSHSLKRPAQS
jgi:hypothetical protein